ncbi:MAG: LysE family transporter [Desulfomicrobium sp.]|nr:LysE family transporter [Pseudomonadota bacterium]MBV1712879.1 LysE family transporter [Desulfomicrobium sp.]MBU4571849.1 LysE family transporter [Pseudomonadota bacterium]MBU4595998.1 LysE family transporter [Pseudomonadota bacterium]MBV1721302.1 LysE family transporter [Desulfomicrobium sp.]
MLELFTVATITILAVISPGADFAMVSRNSMMMSRRAGILTAIGISLGVLVHVTYSLLGVGLVISRSVLLFNLIKYLGAAYLIYLGVSMIRTEAAPSGIAPRPVLSDAGALRIGFLTNASNPKTTLFVVSLFTQVINPGTPLAVQLGYGAFMSLAHLVWFALVACAFSSAPAQRAVGSVRRHVERGIGCVLVALGLTLALASLNQA